MSNSKNEGPMNWDTSDTPIEPASGGSRRRPPPIPIKVKDASGRPVGLPGMPHRNRTKTAQVAVSSTMRREAPDRARSNTMQQMAPAAPQAPSAPSAGGSFDVEVPGIGTYRVNAISAEQARQALVTWFREDQDNPADIKELDPRFLKVTPTPKGESSSAGGSLAGHQSPTYERLRHAVRAMVAEVVRKKDGGGGYVLYGPNKGKKKNPKPAGEFPTRLAAKRAELARFPPKDPEQLKKLRKRLDKLNKDPKKRADAEKKEREAATRPKRTGKPAGARRKKREAIVRMMARDLHERLFHEEEVPGSPWDERIASMHPAALSTDKKLAAFNKAMQLASVGALGDAHKMMSKILRGMAKVRPGEHAHDPERQKTFMPIMLDVDGTEVGPVHLYVDGGQVKIEVSDEARQTIQALDPGMARDLRGGLMSFQEDALPKVDRAKRAWMDRDSYLDKVHAKLEKQFGSMSGVEHHLVRQLLNKARRR